MKHIKDFHCLHLFRTTKQTNYKCNSSNSHSLIRTLFFKPSFTRPFKIKSGHINPKFIPPLSANQIAHTFCVNDKPLYYLRTPFFRDQCSIEKLSELTIIKSVKSYSFSYFRLFFSGQRKSKTLCE